MLGRLWRWLFDVGNNAPVEVHVHVHLHGDQVTATTSRGHTAVVSTEHPARHVARPVERTPGRETSDEVAAVLMTGPKTHVKDLTGGSNVTLRTGASVDDQVASLKKHIPST